jgi:hypothetical protein
MSGLTLNGGISSRGHSVAGSLYVILRGSFHRRACHDGERTTALRHLPTLPVTVNFLRRGHGTGSYPLPDCENAQKRSAIDE